MDRYKDANDWREEYLMGVFDQISHTVPKVRTSYMFPAVLKDQVLRFATPLNTCLVFKIGKKASFQEIFDLEETSNEDMEFTPFSLRLRRGFDLAKVMNLEYSVKSLGLLRKRGKIAGISSILERKGPHKSISLDLQIQTSHLFWCTFAYVDDLRILEDYLQYLKISGIGKKRSMGWGDLKKFEVYEWESDSSLDIFIDKLVYTQNNEKFIETIRPKELKEIQNMVKNGKRILMKSHFGQGATDPPYWGKETVVYCAKLVEKK